MNELMPRSKSAAKKAGERHYFTGQPCKYGHVTHRMTANGTCSQCLQLRKKRVRSEDYERVIAVERATERAWRAANREAYNAKQRLRVRDKTQKQAMNARYRARNPEKVKACRKAWYENNKSLYAAYVADRRSSQLLRTPGWTTPKMTQQIRDVYANARLLTELTGVLHEVDHFFPLRGKLVSGLHVPENLRIVTREVNRKKNAKMPETKSNPHQTEPSKRMTLEELAAALA